MTRSRTKAHALRATGGLIAAMAVLPWFAGASAQAAGPGTCSTIPSGVSSSATCTPLLGPNGTTVFGETWAWRTGGNTLKVDTFPLSSPGAGNSVILCVTSAGAYPAKHQCNAGDPGNVYAGSSTTIAVPLDNFGITASDPAFYSLSVLQASTTANSNGDGGAAPSQSPTPTPTRTHTHTPTPTPTQTSASPSPTRTHTHTPSPTPTETSASPSATATSQSPSASVSASNTHHTDGPTPSASVLGVKLAHTGANGTSTALAVSLGLLAIGGILVAAGQTTRPSRRH